MKLLLTVVALVAVAHGAPTTQTMDIGANGVSGSLSIPLVEIIVNMIKDSETAVPEIANEPVLEAHPVIVVDEAQNLEPVIVVEQPVEVITAPEVNPIDVISINPVAPEPEVVPAPVVLPAPAPAEVVEVNPIDVISVNPVPAPIVLPAPAPAEVVEVNPIDVISVNPVPAPIVLPAPAPAEVVEVNPIDVISVNPVPAPIVLPAPAPAEVVEVNPIDVISVNPVPAPIVLPEPTPAEVVPAPVDVIEVPSVINPEPVQVVEAPAVAVEAGEAGASQIINVMMNFIFGESGALSSVEVPAHVIPQIVASAPRV